MYFGDRARGWSVEKHPAKLVPSLEETSELLKIIDLVVDKDNYTHVVGRTSERGGYVYHNVHDIDTKKLVSEKCIKDKDNLISFIGTPVRFKK